MKKLYIWGLYIFLTPLSQAFSNDGCADILQFGLWENHSSSKNSSKSNLAKNWFCDKSLNQTSESKKGTLGYSGFSLGAGAAEQSKSVKSLCRKAFTSSEDEASNESQWNTASAQIVDAWTQCKNQDYDGVTAYIDYLAERSDVFFVKHKYREDDEINIKISSEDQGIECITPDNGIVVSTENWQQVMCKRTSEAEKRVGLLSVTVPDGSKDVNRGQGNLTIPNVEKVPEWKNKHVYNPSGLENPRRWATSFLEGCNPTDKTGIEVVYQQDNPNIPKSPYLFSLACRVDKSGTRWKFMREVMADNDANLANKPNLDPDNTIYVGFYNGAVNDSHMWIEKEE